MKNTLKLLIAIAIINMVSYNKLAAQENETSSFHEHMQKDPEKKAHFGMYGQFDYNQPFQSGILKNGTLDIHRLVGFIGYHFNKRVSFVSEIEIEHVNEIFVEQAILNFSLNDYINFRGGLLLIPMGIVNEYHEPPIFNGVERPNIDSKLVPTTWRELGAGIFGKINSASIKYQLYAVNGFNGYDSKGKFNGESVLRSGRQKGIASYISSPCIAGKIEHYGIPGLKLGLSIYSGRSQSKLYDGVAKNDMAAINKADSSSVKISMIGADARYQWKGIQARGQFIYISIPDAGRYNAFTGNDLAEAVPGYYVELGFDWFSLCKNAGSKMVSFARYEQYFTHHKVPVGVVKNLLNNRTDLTVGLGFYPSDNVVVKADYQRMTNETNTGSKNQFNFGLGFWFY